MPPDELPPSEPSLPVVPGYELLALVGRGGMGRVYKAVHLGLGRTVAIKLLTATDDDDQLARFREEARAVAHLQHPNIVQVFESGTVHGQPYFSQEFLEGGSLAAKLREGPLSPEAAATLLETVARAIHHSHKHGVLHRDIKPANILLAADGTPKVSDFGLAKRLDRETNLTRTGEILGTPAYMAPEQASGVANDVGPAADIYALGALLYELLTGRPPFQGPDALQTVMMVLTMDPVSPRALQPQVPKDLETICLKCLEKSPKKRYATADDLAEDLRRFLSGEAIVARPVGLSERSLKWAKRHKAGAAFIGALVVLFAVTVASAVLLSIGYRDLDKANTELGQKNTELEQSNERLAKSQGETETMLNYALGTMDQYHFALSDRLKDLPQGQELRVEVLEQARTTLDGLFAVNPRRPLVWEYLMGGYDMLGNAQASIGELEKSRLSHQRAGEAARRLAKEYPDNPTYPANDAIAQLKIGNVLAQQGQEKEAARYFAESEKVAAELLAKHPDHNAVLKLNYLAHQRPMMDALLTDKPDVIVAAYQRYADLARRLAKSDPSNAVTQTYPVNWELRLATYQAIHNMLPQAQAILTRAKPELDKLPEPKSPNVRGLRALYHETVAVVADNSNKPADADTAYRAALAEYESLAKDYPKSPSYRRSIANTWWSIGLVWQFSGRPDDARASYHKALEVVDKLITDYSGNTQLLALRDQIQKSLKQLPPPGAKK